MVWRWSDLLCNPKVSHKAQISINGSECAVLRLQQHLHHGHQIPRHFTAMLPAPLLRYLQFAGFRIGGFCNPQKARADALALAAANQEIRTNCNLYAFDLVGSKFGGIARAILRIPNAFSRSSNKSMISMHRRASSRAFGLMVRSAAFMVNASLTRIRISGERRGSALYARRPLIASPLAVTIGGRENLQSCSTFCCASGRIIKYSAKAAADIRGSCRTRTDV